MIHGILTVRGIGFLPRCAISELWSRLVLDSAMGLYHGIYALCLRVFSCLGTLISWKSREQFSGGDMALYPMGRNGILAIPYCKGLNMD